MGKEYNGMSKTRYDVANFMEHQETLTQLSGEAWHQMENDLTEFVDKKLNEKTDNIRLFLLRDCVEWNTIYKILVFNNDVSKKEVQEEIWKIKNTFSENEFDEWTIDDVMDELSKKYDFTSFSMEGDIEV